MKITTLIKLASAPAVFGLAFAVCTLTANAAGLPPDSTQTGLNFANNIKPIFDHSCTRCHHGEKPKAHLKLDTLAGVLKGSEDGKVVIPGNSAKSPLVLAISHATKDRHKWMPPLHNRAGIEPLTPEQIGMVRAWIDQGAK